MKTNELTEATEIIINFLSIIYEGFIIHFKNYL